jgi:hypothetical protein
MGSLGFARDDRFLGSEPVAPGNFISDLIKKAGVRQNSP